MEDINTIKFEYARHFTVSEFVLYKEDATLNINVLYDDTKSCS